MVTLATLYNDFKTLIKQNFYDKDEVDDALSDKQDTLVSGTSIKTINNNSLLGSGNITISGSGTVDSSLSTTSTNPVQNQAITNEINSLNTSITNFLEDNKFVSFWTDGNVTMYVNKAVGISYIHFNKNVTISANNSVVIHSEYNQNAVEVQYCPATATYCPTSRNNVFLSVSYVGEIKAYNRSSSAINNVNVQGMMTWRAKGYPK